MLIRRSSSSLSRVALVAAAAALTAMAASVRARAQEVGPSREELASGIHHRPIDSDQGENPFRGSTFLFEQSMTTQTTQLQPSAEQSYVPLYELWLSFRPRYYFDEHWNVRGRFDYTKELTNNQSTTSYREDVFGDIWADLVYSAKLDALWPGTRVGLGSRALLPTSKVSQTNGTFVTLGATASALHKFEINGEDAPFFNDFHINVGLVYLHPFSHASTPTSYGNFSYARQDVGVDDRSILSDQVQGQTVVSHNLWGLVEAGLQITPRLSFTADALLIDQWHYAPSNGGIQITTGPVNPPQNADTQLTESVWLIGSFDYTLFDEVDLSLGYYNLTNALAADGQRRGLFGSDNIWWSPDARVFFDVTANLDVVYDDLTRHRLSQRSGQAMDQAVHQAVHQAVRTPHIAHVGE